MVNGRILKNKGEKFPKSLEKNYHENYYDWKDKYAR